MTVHRYSLLPENASALERAFERAFSDMLEDIGAPFPELLDPQRSPPAALPYLAQDRGVAEWDGGASVELRRRTVRNVWAIRRLAGTRDALVLAVDEMDYDAEVIAWYDPGAEFTEPYQVEVIAWKRGSSGIDQGITEQMLRNLDYAKSERDELTLTLALGFSSGFRVSGAISPPVMHHDDRYGGAVQASPDMAGGVGVAAGAAPITLATDDHHDAAVQPAPAHSAPLAMAGGLYTISVTDH